MNLKSEKQEKKYVIELSSKKNIPKMTNTLRASPGIAHSLGFVAVILLSISTGKIFTFQGSFPFQYLTLNINFS